MVSASRAVCFPGVWRCRGLGFPATPVNDDYRNRIWLEGTAGSLPNVEGMASPTCTHATPEPGEPIALDFQELGLHTVWCVAAASASQRCMDWAQGLGGLGGWAPGHLGLLPCLQLPATFPLLTHTHTHPCHQPSESVQTPTHARFPLVTLPTVRPAWSLPGSSGSCLLV